MVCCYFDCQLVAVGAADAAGAGAGTGCEAVAETRVVAVVVMRNRRGCGGGGVGGVEMGWGVARSWVHPCGPSHVFHNGSVDTDPSWKTCDGPQGGSHHHVWHRDADESGVMVLVMEVGVVVGMVRWGCERENHNGRRVQALTGS